MPPFKESQPSAPPQASAPQNPSPIVPQQEDTRWDIDKAETVGRATYEVAQDFNYMDLDNPFERQKWDRMMTSGYSPEQQAKDIAKIEAPFETLYNLKPETFAQLPLAEFIDAAKEFRLIEARLQSSGEEVLESVQTLRSSLEGNLEKRQAFYGEFWKHMWDIFKYGGIPESERQALYNSRVELRKIANGFDTTPRQIIEEYIKIVDRYLEMERNYDRNYIEQAKKDRKEFLAKYGISENTQEAPAE